MKKLLTLAFLGLLSLGTVAAKDITLSESNTVAFRGYFDSENVGRVIQDLGRLDGELRSSEPIYLVLISGGGSIYYGLQLIDFINGLDRPVHTVTSFSASMAFQTVQLNNKGDRFITSTGTLMSHKASGGFQGDFPRGTIISRYEYWVSKLTGFDKVIAKRAGISLKKYQSLYDQEYWCTGAECVKGGFADEIVNVRCDESLTGAEEKSIIFSNFGRTFKLSYNLPKCPVTNAVNGRELSAVTEDSENIISTHFGKSMSVEGKYSKAINKALEILDTEVSLKPLYRVR